MTRTHSTLILALVAIVILIAAPVAAQSPQPSPLFPIDDTYLSTGVVSNLGSPYLPAPYVAGGTLVTSSSATLPMFAGMRYELYRDATGRPAYAGMATLKVVIYRKAIGSSGRQSVYLFADPGIGGAGSVSSISSAIQLGGGAGFQFARHWSAVVEPQARRVPALENGFSKAVLAGIVYTFNRPR